MKRRTRISTILSFLIAVNIAIGGAEAAPKVEEDTRLRDECYKLMGIALFEENILLSITKDENGFNAQVNEEEWEGLDKKTKDALKVCLVLFVDVNAGEEI